MVILYTDGASKNNPGLAGIGYVIYDNDVIVTQGSYCLPDTTNNIAEICGMIIGLEEVSKFFHIKKILLKSDSLLLVNQCKNIYKIKNTILQKGHAILRSRFSAFSIEFQHIDREENKIADALANKGIYEKISLSKDNQEIIAPLFL